MSASAERRLWAIVPAAGRGERFSPSSSALPKQYTPLLGRSVLEWSLRVLLAEPRIHAIVVVLAAADGHWAAFAVPAQLAPAAAVTATTVSTRSSRVNR